MTRVEIITAMREANHNGWWPQLCERLRGMDGDDVFHALFPIATDSQSDAPACDAAIMLFAVRPTCPISCKDAVRGLLSNWGISVEELPWYLANCFGEETLRQTTEDLLEEPLVERERLRAETVWYWAEIFFSLTPEELQRYEQRAWRGGG